MMSSHFSALRVALGSGQGGHNQYPAPASTSTSPVESLVASSLPLCLSVSFILLPIPSSRTDFHQKKKLPRVVLLMSENPVPAPDCTDTAVKYHGYGVIKIVQGRERVLTRLFGIHVTVSVDSLSANIKP